MPEDKSKSFDIKTTGKEPPTPSPKKPDVHAPPPPPDKLLFGTEDGWHFLPDHPQLHYFFKNASLCRLYFEKPEGCVHKNVPLLQCSKCNQVLKKLIGVQQYLIGKEMNAKQVFTLLEILERIKLNKGLTDKENTPEHVVVVIGHKDGTKTTLESGINPNAKKK